MELTITHLFETLRKHWIIVLIFLFGLFLRTHNLSEFPVGLHGDEASIGYNAYSLLKTAKDQNGHFLPIAIDQFGDFRPAGYHYIDIPFVALLGLDALAVRLPAALFGTASILVFYFLLKELFATEHISLLGAFLLAILPWDINISRASSESVIATFFAMLGAYCYITHVKRKSPSNTMLILSFFSFFISFFFYHAPRYFTPFFLPVLIVSCYLAYRPAKEKIIKSIFLYGLVLISVVFFLTAGKGTGRASEVSIFNTPGGTIQLKQAMDEEGTLNPLITRFYDNKLFYYGRLFVLFYSQHLTGDFLFVNTGSPLRYKIPFTGNLYPLLAPFLILGFVFLLYESIKQKKYVYIIPLAWFFIAPIPAGLTWEDVPNVIRSSLLIPALLMLTAFGFYQVLLITKNKIRIIFLVICSLLILQNFLYFYHNYYWRLKVHEPWHRSAAEPELINTVVQLSQKYPEIVMSTQSNNNFIFYLFYTKFDPATFQNLGSPQEHDKLRFGKLLYTYIECPITGTPKINQLATLLGSEKSLFVERASCALPKNAKVIDTIRTTDGIPAFFLIQLKHAKTETS